MSDEKLKARYLSSRCLMQRHGESCAAMYDECSCECHGGAHPLPFPGEEPAERHGEEP